MFSLYFWQNTAERAIKTAAQSALSLLGTEALVNALEVDWPVVAGVAAGGAVLSVLSSVGSIKVGTFKDDPSLV